MRVRPLVALVQCLLRWDAHMRIRTLHLHKCVRWALERDHGHNSHGQWENDHEEHHAPRINKNNALINFKIPRNLQYGIVNVEACGGRRISQLDDGTISWVCMASTVLKVRNVGR